MLTSTDISVKPKHKVRTAVSSHTVDNADKEHLASALTWILHPNSVIKRFISGVLSIYIRGQKWHIQVDNIGKARWTPLMLSLGMSANTNT